MDDAHQGEGQPSHNRRGREHARPPSEYRLKPWKQSDWRSHAAWWPSSTAAHGSYREDWPEDAPDHHDGPSWGTTTTIEVKDETPTPDQEADLVGDKDENEPTDPAPDVDANEKGAQWDWAHKDGRYG